uniref:Ubiquitin-like protease family profile domain-containing protein n=1 Tax=Ditylenchus dipsaci TaxID=166011 RepID=A0A915DEM9_9BILA
MLKESSPFSCLETCLQQLSIVTNTRCSPERFHHVFANTKDFPVLPEESDLLIDKIWHESAEEFPLDEMCVEKFGVSISRRDLLKLKSIEWLNDEIINFYMQLIVQRSTHEPDLPKVFAFNSFFFTSLKNRGFAAVKRWTKSIDLSSFDIILVPIHDKTHWSLAVIDMQNQSIEYYDSMLTNRADYVLLLKQYIIFESLDKRKSKLDLESWKFGTKYNIPKQSNGSDCGVFVCRFADYISQRKQINFEQIHMKYFRRRMVYEICTGTLL